MKLHLYQIIISLVAILMVLQGIKSFASGKTGQTFLKLIVRILVWGGMAIVAIYPAVTKKIAGFIGMEDNVNAVILTGFILIFLIIFKLLSAIEKLEQQMTEVTRKESLKEIKNGKQD